MMASNVFECEICNEEFDSDAHKPLFLNCGHTFCSKCLLFVAARGSGGCPRCRQQIAQPVDQLSINFSLIPALKNEVSETHYSSQDRCKTHGCALDYLCLDCGNLICWKCSRVVHLNHRVESMADVANNDSSPDARKAFRHKLQLKLNRLQDSLYAPREVLQLIEELVKYKAELEQRQDSISTLLTSAAQDLQAWDSSVFNSPEDNNRNLREIIRRFETPEFLKNQKMPKIHAMLERLQRKTLDLEDINEELSASFVTDATLNTGVLLPDHGCWSMSNEASSQITLISAHAGRKAEKITVISMPTAPIKRLFLRLCLLGDACSGSMIVKDMDTFWQAAPERGRYLLTFCGKHGHKVTQYYGSPVDALAVSRARGHSSLSLGVRLTQTRDVDQCSTLSHRPVAVSCIRGLPAAAAERMKQLGWRPLSWHFPDLQDGDLDWLYALMDQFFVPKLFRFYLPRCSLSETGLRRLIKKYAKHKLPIFCETSSISRDDLLNVEYYAQCSGVDLHWGIPVDDVFI